MLAAVQPRPDDLAALASLLADDAIVLSLDAEACAAPGGDARSPTRARVVQLGIAAFSPARLPCPDGGQEVTRGARVDPDADVFGDEAALATPDVVGYWYSDQTYVDPGCRIDADSARVHRITDAAVRGAPSMVDVADELAAWLAADGRKVYLAGYNATRYDSPLLAAELERVGRADVAAMVRAAPVLDSFVIRRAAEPPMTLGGTLRRYGLDELGDDAHSAGADSAANLAVLAAQVACGHLSSLDAAAAAKPASPPDGAVDPLGKLKWAGGKPVSEPKPDDILVDFGKHKGRTLRQAGQSYCQWLCKSDFDDELKQAVRGAWGPAAARW